MGAAENGAPAVIFPDFNDLLTVAVIAVYATILVLAVLKPWTWTWRPVYRNKK